MSTKHNSTCLAKAADDEPIFVLRAQDFSAPGIIEQWIAANRQTLHIDKMAEARNVVDEMRAWHNRRPPT